MIEKRESRKEKTNLSSSSTATYIEETRAWQGHPIKDHARFDRFHHEVLDFVLHRQDNGRRGRLIKFVLLVRGTGETMY